MAAIALFNGAIFGRDHSLGALYLAAYVGIAISFPAFAYAWCKADIEERHLAYPSGIPLLFVLLPYFGVPIYFFRTRRIGGALLGLLGALLFLTACLLLMGIGAAVASG